jgi:hypothetical protein
VQRKTNRLTTIQQIRPQCFIRGSNVAAWKDSRLRTVLGCYITPPGLLETRRRALPAVSALGQSLPTLPAFSDILCRKSLESRKGCNCGLRVPGLGRLAS